MVAVIATILLSKNIYIPASIFAYYALYAAVQSATIGSVIDSFPLVETSFDLATIYYISFAAIELLIIIALCINSNKYKKIGIVYSVFVLTSMIFNATQAVSMSIESNWFINIYSIRQQIAIPLDIIFAILGSDNFVSRKFYITLNNSGHGNDADNRNNFN